MGLPWTMMYIAVTKESWTHTVLTSNMRHTLCRIFVVMLQKYVLQNCNDEYQYHEFGWKIQENPVSVEKIESRSVY